MSGELPVSPALNEADKFSLTELFSRDPEGYTRQDRDQIIAALRAQRTRQTQTAGAPRVQKVKQAVITTTANIADLGL